jgi:hypothetical protein
MQVSEPTVEANLRLMTPRGLAGLLGVIGICWEPAPFAEARDYPDSLLYLWVLGGSKSKDSAPDDLIEMAGMYLGIGEGVDPGSRIRKEFGWLDGFHAHAISMSRSESWPVCGPVDCANAKAPDYVLNQLVDSERTAAIALFDSGLSLGQVEYLSIRLSIFAGTAGFPVNSNGKNAWNLRRGTTTWTLNELAWAICQNSRLGAS